METINPARGRIAQVTVACGVLATVAVILRFVARWRSKASFAADDWWMVASLIPSYGMLAVGSIMITGGGGGQHADTLTENQTATFLKTLDAAVMTYSVTIAMVKISILLLYRRIFDTLYFRRATTIVGLACLAWLIAALLCLAFQCHTEAERYNADSLFSNQCIDLKAYWVSVTGSNMALDLIILSMPLYMVWNLRLATRQKIALSGIFALGALVCVAGLMRIITIDLVKGGDLPYTVITCYMWSQIEPTMAIVCACLTTMRPLFTGFNLSILSPLTWKGRSTFSSLTANSKGRRSDLTDDGGKDPRKEKEERTRPLYESYKSDSQLLGLEQLASPGTQESVVSVESRNISLEDDTSTSLRVERGTSMV